MKYFAQLAGVAYAASQTQHRELVMDVALSLNAYIAKKRAILDEIEDIDEERRAICPDDLHLIASLGELNAICQSPSVIFADMPILRIDRLSMNHSMSNFGILI
jgi:hypothetical protein